MDAALRWLEGLYAALETVEHWPRRFHRAREELPGFELRQVNYKSHRAIFAIVDDRVHVLHVRHVAQDNVEFRDLPDLE